MKTFNVKKTFRNEDRTPIETKIVGTVTAYNFNEAMGKAADKYNNGNWDSISVEKKAK